MTASADLRARLAALWHRAHSSTPVDAWPQVTRLTTGPALARVPDGFTPWAVGPWIDDPAAAPPAGRHVVVLPTLAGDAPLDVRHRYLARLVALGTGRCPLCSAVAGLSRQIPEPGEPGRAAFHALPLVVTVNHSVGCPADSFGEEDRRFFVPPTGTRSAVADPADPVDSTDPAADTDNTGDQP